MFVAFAIPLPPSTLMDNYMHLPFLHSSPVGLVITRYPVILVGVPRIPYATALRFLAAKISLRFVSSHLSRNHSLLVVHRIH